MYHLPETTVARLMKESLPDNAQIGKEVKTLMARSGGLFILYLMHVASEHKKKSTRKTLTADDVMNAIEEEFKDLSEPMQDFLESWRAEHGRNSRVSRGSPRGKGKTAKEDKEKKPRSKKTSRKVSPMEPDSHSPKPNAGATETSKDAAHDLSAHDTNDVAGEQDRKRKREEDSSVAIDQSEQGEQTVQAPPLDDAPASVGGP